MEKALNRQRVLLHHLRPNSSLSSATQTHESSDLSASICAAGDSAAYHRTAAFGDDIVIVAAYRTAICKAKRGGFKDTLADDLLAPVLKAVIERTNLNPSEVGDIVVGTVLAPGSLRAIECRMAAFYAGFPDTVPIRTVNRQCSSGLQAVADVAAFIKAGYYDIGIAAGVECMSVDSIGSVRRLNPKAEAFAQARDCLLPMGVTSENVAQRYGVTRQEQDQAAVSSIKYLICIWECPDYLSTDIQSLTFASSKCLDIPELQTVKTIFEKKFGTDFVAVAINLLPGCNVHQEMRSLLATEPPTLAKKLETLKKIAKENNIDWSYSKETLEYEHWDTESEFEDSNEYLYPAPTLAAPHIHPKLPDYENLSRFFHDLFTEQKRGSIEKLT